MKQLWYIFNFLIGYNLIFPFILFLLYKLGVKQGQLSQKAKGKLLLNYDYAIIVTAYQETAHITATVNSILQSSYTNYLIYVVLDNCSEDSSLQFSDERVIILRPENILAGNVKSHFYAIERFKRDHSIITIIDSDNLVHHDYLSELNKFFSKGYKAVQGIREPKNLDSHIACLDAARDIYYHFYDGYLLFNIGASSTLAGSGMAFHTQLYKDSLVNTSIEGAGFDKVLQYQIVKRNERIAFSKNAIVYDHKTAKSDQLVNQRARWINTWFKYFAYGFDLIFKGIRNLSLNQFLFGIVLLRPPLFIFLFLSILMLMANFFISTCLVWVWSIGFIIFIIGFWLSINIMKADSRIKRSLKYAPVFIFYQFVSLANVKNANKRSVATKHYSDEK